MYIVYTLPSALREIVGPIINPLNPHPVDLSRRKCIAYKAKPHHTFYRDETGKIGVAYIVNRDCKNMQRI
jgi:hypothetical protein